MKIIARENKFMKKMLPTIITCFAMVIVALSSTGCNATTVDNGYKTITQNVLKQASAFEMLNTINQEERDLVEFFEKKYTTEENDKIFSMFYKDLVGFQDNLYNQRDKQDITILKIMEINNIKLKNKGFDEKTKQTVNIIIAPNTSVVYLDTSQDWFTTIRIDYNYIIKQYSQYLSPAWQEYLHLENEKNTDYSIGAWYDDEHWGDIYVKWVNKWEKFLKQYPDFYLQDKIKENINGIKGTSIWEYANENK